MLLIFLTSPLPAQESAKTGGSTRFTTTRHVQIPAAIGHPEVVVVEFFTHGELHSDGSNLAVSSNLDRPVPWRVLQVGPGDFCRVAFQTVAKQSVYRIVYGGSSSPKPPSWTNTSGLVLRTYRWKPCDLGSAASVRAAIESAEPIGSDFVVNVFHGYNPFWPEPDPFLSVYRGSLHIKTAGNYHFYTSSQDCSFLFLDGKQVVAAPGRHGPVGDARIRGDVALSAGEHQFEYLHAASGEHSCMVAAWQTPEAKQPESIPAEAFHSGQVAHLTPGRPHHVNHGTMRDFTFEVLGEVPLAGSDLPLIRVRFKEIAAPDVMARSESTPQHRVHWEFDDGMTSDESEPIHVYLHPGLFTVKLGSGPGKTVNRMHVHFGAALPQGKKGRGGDAASVDQAADYVLALNRYEEHKLDALSVLQLVRFCEQVEQHERAVRIGKAWLLANARSQGAGVRYQGSGIRGQESGVRSQAGPNLTPDSRSPTPDEIVHAMVEIVGPMLRDRFGDSASALAVWQAAAAALQRSEWKGACEVAAADISLNDLHESAKAGPLLEAATSNLEGINNAPLFARLYRLWGDWHSRTGNKKEALASYAKAAAKAPQQVSAERDARRGAFSRSTEAFLREKSLDRAWDELCRWQDEFPQDKVGGYLPLLLARYHIARGKLQHAIVVANDLLVVNAESPYADQIAFLAGECEERLAQPDRARAAYQTLITDYPGSPLVQEAKQKLAKLTNPEPPPTPLRK